MKFYSGSLEVLHHQKEHKILQLCSHHPVIFQKSLRLCKLQRSVIGNAFELYVSIQDHRVVRSLVGIIWSSVGNASRIYPFHSLPKGYECIVCGYARKSIVAFRHTLLHSWHSNTDQRHSGSRSSRSHCRIDARFHSSIHLPQNMPFPGLLHPIDIFSLSLSTVIMHPFVCSICYICPCSALVNIYDMAVMVSIYEDCIFQLAKPLQDLPR